jgi:RNA polymerase sigma-70 factor (ECF subfamily)
MDTVLITHQGQAAPKSERIFAELYSLYYDEVNSFLLKIVGEKPTAEDLAQNVFMKFWLSMDRFQIDDYKAYIFIMARNEAITHLRKVKHARNINRRLCQCHVQGVNFTEGMILQKETETLLQNAIQYLSPQRKRVYLLCKM